MAPKHEVHAVEFDDATLIVDIGESTSVAVLSDQASGEGQLRQEFETQQWREEVYVDWRVL